MKRKLFTSSIDCARRGVRGFGLGVITLALLYSVSGGAATERMHTKAAPSPGLIVHEWGTFVSMQGSVMMKGMLARLRLSERRVRREPDRHRALYPACGGPANRAIIP
jgi:hypothetical protein